MEHGAGSEEEGNCAGERNPEVRGQKSEVREWQRASAFAGGAARLRGIMSKIVKGVVETRSLKCMRLRRGYPFSVIRSRKMEPVITGQLTTLRAGDLYEPEADQRIPVLMKFAVNFSDSGVSNLKSAIIPACF